MKRDEGPSFRINKPTKNRHNMQFTTASKPPRAEKLLNNYSSLKVNKLMSNSEVDEDHMNPTTAGTVTSNS